MSAPTAPMPPELALLRIRAVQGGPDDWMRLGQALVGADEPRSGGVPGT